MRAMLQEMSSGRVTLSGKVAILEGADAADAKAAFVAKNPESFWVEFGDFSWFRMDTVVTARLVGGFGRIKQVLLASLAGCISSACLIQTIVHCSTVPPLHHFVSQMCGLQISAEEFAAAKSDPVAQFAAPVAQHMNADHADSIVAMLKHSIGIDVDAGSILSLDRCRASAIPTALHCGSVPSLRSVEGIRSVIICHE